MATVSSGSNYLCRHSNYEHFRHGVLAGIPGTENRAESRGQRRLNPKPQLPKRREQLCERRRGARLEMRKKFIEEAAWTGKTPVRTRSRLSQKLELPHPAVVQRPDEANRRPLQPVCEVTLPLHGE